MYLTVNDSLKRSSPNYIIAIWKNLYLSEAATSVNADVGIATNSLKDKLTVSTIVAWKISRGSERNLQENKENQGVRDQVIQSPYIYYHLLRKFVTNLDQV